MPAAAVFVMNMMRSKSGKRWPAQQQTQLLTPASTAAALTRPPANSSLLQPETAEVQLARRQLQQRQHHDHQRDGHQPLQ